MQEEEKPFVFTGDIIRDIRKKHNLSQTDLAIKCGLSPKYGHMTIVQWENHEGRAERLKPDYYKKLMQLLKS